MNIQELFTNQAKQILTDKVTETLGTDKISDQIVEGALNQVLGQLGKNASDTKGASSIFSALEKHTGNGFNVDIDDGAKILGHIFGDKSKDIVGTLAKKSNIDVQDSNTLLALVSSFAMENLGNAKAKGDLTNNNISGILSMATSFLDSDKDGSIIDDLIKIVRKMFFKK